MHKNQLLQKSLFQFLHLFPKRNKSFSAISGKAMVAEKSSVSLESDGLSKESERRLSL